MNKFTVSIICLAVVFGAVRSYPEEDGDILSDPLSNKPFSMPESCKTKNMSFCFENDGYPIQVVEDLLKDMTNLEVAKENDVGLIENRQGSPDEYDCRAQANTAPIYYIVDEYGRDRVVVQMEGKFQQRYSVMWCDKPGRITTKTPHFMLSTVEEYKMMCENKYMQYDFLVLTLKPNMVGQYSMERARTKIGIPVCCACRYEKKN